MSDGYNDSQGRPMSGMPVGAMEAEHERRMARTTLEVRDGTELWQVGGNYTDRLVAVARDQDIAHRIADRWVGHSEWRKLAEERAAEIQRLERRITELLTGKVED